MQPVARPYLDKGRIEVIEPPTLADAQSTYAVPSYVAEGGLKTFADIARFDKLGGRIYAIEPGSGSNRITRKMIDDNRFGLKGFQLVESSEAGMLTAVKRAIKRKQWVVFFGWKPHPMNLQIDMTYLTGSEDVFGPDEGAATVSTMTAAGYQAQCGNVARLLHNLRFSSAQVSQVMAPILDRTQPLDAARQWLKANPEPLKAWLDGVSTFDGKRRPGRAPGLAEVTRTYPFRPARAGFTPRIQEATTVNHEVIVTCAVTGAGDTVGRHPAIPVTPKQIAEAAIEAARAGATVAHCHVRDPATGKPSRDVALYREVVERIRESDTDVIINLTAGMGGDLEIGKGEQPLEFGAGTDLVGPLERLRHVECCRKSALWTAAPSISATATTSTSPPLRNCAGARRITELGVKAELEIFDTGHLWFAKQMLKEGLLEDPLFQICLGIPWGAPADTTTMKAMADNLPPGRPAGFGIGRTQMPMVAQAMLLGGNVRVGLEDNIWLDKGVPASNGSLVERAIEIIERLGGRARARRKGAQDEPEAALISSPRRGGNNLLEMSMSFVTEIKTFAALGSGVIGSGWIARALATASTSSPGIRRRAPKRRCARASPMPGRPCGNRAWCPARRRSACVSSRASRNA